jgi:hypothetical protein
MKKIVSILLSIFMINTSLAHQDNGVTREELKLSNERIKEILKEQEQHPGVPPKFTQEEEYMLFGKDGLPIPNSGVKVVQLNESLVIRNTIDEFKKNGYVKKYSQNAVALSTIEHSADEQFKSFSSYKDRPYDTRMRHNWDEMKIAYVYKPVPSDLIAKTIGFSPESTFIKNGWTGVSQFFVPKGHSFVCAYREVSIPLTGTSAVLNQEIVSNEVNEKITTLSIEGDLPSGYLYELMWWDKEFRRQLQCSADVYSEPTKKSIIELARLIDQK